ncbi:MAG: hypothetical protein PIR53_10570 [Nocardioides alkalitolerans]
MTTNPSTEPTVNPHDASEPGRLARASTSITRLCFVVTLVVFLLGGFVIVGAQAVEIVLGDGTTVAAIGERLGPPTFAVSAVCGLLAFVLEYVRRGPGEEGSD